MRQRKEAAQAVAAEEQRLEQFWQPRIRNKGHSIDLPPTGERWISTESAVERNHEPGHARRTVTCGRADTFGVQGCSSESAPDEIIIPFELRSRGYPIQDKGPTYVCWYCEWLGGTQVDASTHEAGTSPSSFVTASSARTICERAREEGFWFVRKMGDGTEASVQAVVLGSTRRDGYRTLYR